MERLRESTKDYFANLAVGMVYMEELGDNLERSVIEAEKRMYEDKEEYYKKAGLSVEDDELTINSPKATVLYYHRNNYYYY